MRFKSTLKVSMDGAETTKSGKEFQVDEPATENERSSDLVDLGTKSLTLLRAAERSDERRRRWTLAPIHAELSTPSSSSCTVPSIAHETSAAYPEEVM